MRTWLFNSTGAAVWAALTAVLVAPANSARGCCDDDHVIRLHAGAIDPNAGLVPVKAIDATPLLHLVQFEASIQPSWHAAIGAVGATVVTYIPENTYLIAADQAAWQRLHAWANAHTVVRWLGDYTPAMKLSPDLSPLTTALAVQVLRGQPTTADTLKLIAATGRIRRTMEVFHYTDLIVECPAAEAPELAQRPDVIWIEPWSPPVQMDERQCQLAAGNFTIAGTVSAPAEPGYLAWLTSRGFTSAQFDSDSAVIDISDSGIDNGTAQPAHPGLRAGGTTIDASRITYNHLIGTPNQGSTLAGCDGHATLNAHIAAGYSAAAGFPWADAAGYHYGLGVCPFARLGSSVIFDGGGFTYPDYAALQSAAYADNARISNNSWGYATANTYNIDAQAFDALVRDCQPAGSPNPAPGNQPMTIVFSAGNSGPFAGSVRAPGTAKNIITVGACEGVQPFGGADGCGNADTAANNADDIPNFSSRGPTGDGRLKPDLVAPGTHISGGVPQAANAAPTGTPLACSSGSGVCGGVAHRYFPNNQQLYTAGSGTSHAAPCVAGAAMLVRQAVLNRGLPTPSPAMTKALLINSARYLRGTGANDTLWSSAQGFGGLNLTPALDAIAGAGTTAILRDQAALDMFTATGQQRTIEARIADPAKPLRITLAWTDAPGAVSGAAYCNNLDLTVDVGGSTYKGNVFIGAFSVTGGTPDARNNVECIFLPPGLSGRYTVTVRAVNINSDGVPGVGGPLDQDYALVIDNARPCPTADFNNDGDTGTDADIEAFFACLAGRCCERCGTADFNADGDTGTDADIEAFFRTLAGAPC